jgi:hypothetical protein
MLAQNVEILAHRNARRNIVEKNSPERRESSLPARWKSGWGRLDYSSGGSLVEWTKSMALSVPEPNWWPFASTSRQLKLEDSAGHRIIPVSSSGSRVCLPK